MSRILFFGLVFGSTIYSLRIPVIIDDSGVPFVDTRIESLYGSEVVRLQLSTTWTTTSRLPIIDDLTGNYQSFREQSISLLNPNTSAEIIRYTADVLYVSNPRTRIYRDTIAVGSHERLVDSFGSVSFVADTPRSGFLELGDSYENFVEHFCIPESVFNISISQFGGSVGFVAGERSGIREIYLSGTSVPGTQLDQLPQELYDPIASTIRSYSSRIVSDSPRLIFEGCDEVLTRLENIDLYFVDEPNHEVVLGHLLFEPADFIKDIQGTENTCELVIGRLDDEDNDIQINLFMLTSVNIRFTTNSASLCESSL